MSDRYAKIREALEMGPTPGSREVFDLGMWDVEVRSSDTSGTICQVNNEGTLFRASEDGADRVGRSQGRLLSDAFFIAACDPDTIRELLAERDALAAENERLRNERDALTEAALAEKDKEIAALREALNEAADALDAAMEDVEHWGSYAGEYFQDKHDLDGDLARISEQATAARRAVFQANGGFRDA